MKLFIGFAFALVLCSCNSKTEEKPPVSIEKKVESTITLSGSSYFFAPLFDAEKCEGIAECDCCSSNILFLDDKHFIAMYPCESDESIFRGTYRVSKDKVILSYDTLQVDREYIWNKEVDADTTGTLKPQYTIDVTSRPATTQMLTIKHCADKLYVTTSEGEEISYGVVDTRYSLNQQIQMLKKEGLWEKINH